MGFFKRFRNEESPDRAQPPPAPRPAARTPPAADRTAPPTPRTEQPAPHRVQATLYTGSETLEVVGESNYQDALRHLAGAPVPGIRVPKIAVLAPEPDNPYDANAIQVQIEAHVVGYLSREDAARYLPGVRRLMEGESFVALEAMIVCGGSGGVFGVFLDHDPDDFGLGRSAPSQRRGELAEMRTGFTEAWMTDVEDDSYDLSWYDDLPHGDRDAVAMLGTLLQHDPDPIDRHFQFAELESRLYRLRDIEPTALDDYDEACRAHDAEMAGICAAFRAKWGKVPLLETYKQMAIRQAKAKDWNECLWWVERGLSLYGDRAARGDSVEDLERRRVQAFAKLEAPPPKKRAVAAAAFSAPIGVAATPMPPPTGIEIEVLTCVTCGRAFERPKVRGRKPSECISCRSSA